MRILLTTNGRLYKTNSGHYYTPIVYGYDFFKRYLDIFSTVRLIAHVGTISEKDAQGMLRVDGTNLEIAEVPAPKGKLSYILEYHLITKAIRKNIAGCDAAILRIPDELAFQVYRVIKRCSNIPIGIEITSNSWDFFSPGSTGGIFRPFLRHHWDRLQKLVCKNADASCYVTRQAIQKRYPPAPNEFSTYCSDVDIELYSDVEPRNYGFEALQTLKILHISGSITGRAKGHKELIESIAILKKSGYNISCTLVGKGNLDEDIQQIVKENSLDIDIVGIKNSKEIKDLFLSHDMFVFPSYREGLPRVVVEAMAAGIVIVATALDGIKELLPDGCLVPVKDSKSLADRIRYFMENPALMSEYSKISRVESEDYKLEELNKRRNFFYNTVKELGSEK